PNGYTITETEPADTTLTGLSCDDVVDSSTDTAPKTATIRVDPGETVTCTFNNTRSAFLTIEKNADPADSTIFAFTTDAGATGGPSDFTSGFSLQDPAAANPTQRTFEFNGNQLGDKSV